MFPVTMDRIFILKAAVFFSLISLIQSSCQVPANMSCTFKVRTATHSFPGTDSNIYITLNGAGGETTGELLLSGSFERGDGDTTQFTAKFIKALDNIVIRHGYHPDWTLPWVVQVVCHDAGIEKVIKDNGWMTTGKKFDARIERSCPDVEITSNKTKVNCTNGNYAGSYCTYSCDDNYLLQGTECIRCLFDSKQWSEPKNSTRCAEKKLSTDVSLTWTVTGAVTGVAVIILLIVVLCKVHRLRRRKDSTDTTRKYPFTRLEPTYSSVAANSTLDLEPYETISAT